MKKTILFIALLFFGMNFSYSQNRNYWSRADKQDFQLTTYAEKGNLPNQYSRLQLDLLSITTTLRNSPDRFETKTSSVLVSFPDSNGNFEEFMMFEASNFEAELKAQFPQINSYVGIGVKDKSSILRLSVDPRGLNGMIFRGNGVTEFFTPISTDGTVYAFYKSERNKGHNKDKKPFTCLTPDEELVFEDIHGRFENETMASDGRLLTFRAAVSCTGEYAQYHGGTVAGALAAINTTMTRVNGLYERDLAIRMVLIGNNNLVVYTDPATDPYTTNYNTELQSTLTSVIGEVNYDVGHLFVYGPDNGNAGCIGCVCNSGKGSAFTAADPPQGEVFDVDYVAHEFGHQFGGRHTFSHSRETGSVAQREVGGGSTIMAYAGITNQNVQMASDDYFHAGSIEQIQANMVGKTCPTSTPITHSAPVVTAGANYTIPISTPFMLTGSATDAGGGALTYCWEQYDTMGNTQGGANSAASPTKASGPNWRSYSPTTSPTRYFPNLNSVFNGSVTTSGSNILVEALSSVARTLNFRLTVRDNEINGGQTNFGNMTVTVDATRGPLTVTSQNTDGIVWAQESQQTITWNVNGTNGSAGGTNVDILYTTNNGQTWIPLLTNTPNDGSQIITVPSITAPNCRIMVKASGNIFFNVNTKNIAIGDYTYETQNICEDYVFNLNYTLTESSDTNYPGIILPITDSYTITDIKTYANVTHPNIGQVNILFWFPWSTGLNTGIWYNQTSCTNANMDKWFDLAGAPASCSTVGGSPFLPFSTGNFAGAIGQNSAGEWRIYTKDVVVDGSGGVLNTFTIQLCRNEMVPVLTSESFEDNNFTLYPNPNNGSFNIQFSSNTGNKININVHDLRGRQIYSNSYSNNGLFNETIELSNIQTGIYLVTVQDGARKVTKKIVVK